MKTLDRYTIVRFILGAMLLVTSVLKLYGLGILGLPSIGWFSQPWVQLTASEWEFVIGLWLISGFQQQLSRFAALVTFLVFACVSSYLGTNGVASCGCLGLIETSPWRVFALDLIAIIILTVSRPKNNRTNNSYFLRVASLWLGLVALSAGLLIVALSIYHGSVMAAIAKVRGDKLTASSSYIDFGSGRLGDTLTANTAVRNWTDSSVRLIGGSADCTCATADDFPLTIQPGESASFRIKLKLVGDRNGRLTRKVTVRTDCSQCPYLHFQLGATIVE